MVGSPSDSLASCLLLPGGCVICSLSMTKSCADVASRQRVQAATPTTVVPTKSESTPGRVRSVHDLGTSRVNRDGSDVLELLWRKFTKTQRADAIVRMTSGVVGQKCIPHNFETLHAKLRYIRPNLLQSCAAVPL